MIKIQAAESGENLVISVEGGITDIFAGELGRFWRTIQSKSSRQIIVNLERVTRVDSGGRQLLKEMYAAGVMFAGARLGIADIVNEVTSAKSR